MWETIKKILKIRFKATWNLALMGLLVYNILLTEGLINFNILSTLLITENQTITNMKLDEIDRKMCMKIDI